MRATTTTTTTTANEEFPMPTLAANEEKEKKHNDNNSSSSSSSNSSSSAACISTENHEAAESAKLEESAEFVQNIQEDNKKKTTEMDIASSTSNATTEILSAVANIATPTMPMPIKRGRGRSKKVQQMNAELTTESPKNVAIVTASLSSSSSSLATNERKVGRKRNAHKVPVEQLPLSDNKISDIADKHKITRRSTRLGNRVESNIKNKDATLSTALNESVEYNKECDNSSLTKLTAAINSNVSDEEILPKKRGRKSKFQLSGMQRGTSTNGGLSVDIQRNETDSTRSLPVVSPLLPKRPKRRIKPTSKILENAELQRITTHQSNTNGNELLNASRDKRDEPNANFIDLTTNSNVGSDDDYQYNSGSNKLIKRKLLTKSTRRDIENFDAALEAMNTINPCPNLEDFLMEVRSSNNSNPNDENLNRNKQQKLTKKKETYFKTLGLQRSTNKNSSDSASESFDSDNDEFVPSTRVHVGKPTITLRLRNASRDKSTRNAQEVNRAQRKAKVETISIPTTTQNEAATNPNVFTEENRVEIPQTQLQSFNAAVLSNNLPDEQSPVHNAHNAHNNRMDLVCLCQKGSSYYTRNIDGSSYCCAVDHMDDQKVGCCRLLTEDMLNLLRPSHRVGYMMLCNEHVKRLQTHNCCAGCGIFCTQGKFVLCKHQHFFHARCAQKYLLSRQAPNNEQLHQRPVIVLRCPHCGADTREQSATVTMNCHKLPVFFPEQDFGIGKFIKLNTEIGCLPNNFPASNETTNINNSSRSNNNNNLGNRSRSNHINFEQLLPQSLLIEFSKRRSSTSQQSDLNASVDTSNMYYAVCCDNIREAARLLARNYNVMTRIRRFSNGTCLHLAADSGTIRMAYLLLLQANQTSHFINAVDNELRTAAVRAVMKDKCDILNLFIECGADVTIKGIDGKTTLHIAAKLGSMEAVQLIVNSYRRSQNITKFLNFLNDQDDGGWTAMIWAAELGHTDVVSFLLRNGADPNICDNDNNSVLHWAILHNHNVDTITLLLQAGTNCNGQNVEGDTPLHIACRHSVTRFAAVLMANGADLMVKNKADQLPYDCIPNENSKCGRTVGFNMQMRSIHPNDLRSYIVCGDISNGRELRPIQVVRNDLMMFDIDDEFGVLQCPDFKYITKSIILQNCIQVDNRVSQMRICSCIDGCSSDQCQCNGASSQNWYTAEGRLISEFNYDDPAVIFECNDVCGCNKLSCKNRVVQNGVHIPMQIVECADTAKGWGVQPLVNVPKGSFIATYIGEILTAPEADRRTDDSYYYDLGLGHYIDANYFGNITRFLNHSCEPNIVAVRVFYEHQDYRFPKIAFFTSRDIKVGEELCYDYGEKFWKATYRKLHCKCLSPSCRYGASSLLSPSSSSSSLLSLSWLPCSASSTSSSPLAAATTVNRSA